MKRRSTVLQLVIVKMLHFPKKSFALEADLFPEAPKALDCGSLLPLCGSRSLLRAERSRPAAKRAHENTAP